MRNYSPSFILTGRKTNPLICTCLAINSLVLPLLEGGQFHVYVTTQAQNAVRRVFALLTNARTLLVYTIKGI